MAGADLVFADFESISDKRKLILRGAPYAKLVNYAAMHKNIYIIANGGLHYVASHMATDMSRLIKDKYVHSFDSFGFITSSANDYGFDSIFVRWLECCVSNETTALLIGLSCSGRSRNILRAFEYANANNWDTFMISGKAPVTAGTEYLTIDANHFHTVECFCLMLFYDLIYSLGHSCPSI
jgi:D-sedoheptulose 7-phosphate isomerase